VSYCSGQGLAVTHDGTAVEADKVVVEAYRRTVIDIHADSMQARPSFGVCRCHPGPMSRLTTRFLPSNDAWIAGWMDGIDLSARCSSSVHDEVRNTTALRRVRRATEAAPLIDHKAIQRNGAIPMQLRELTA